MRSRCNRRNSRLRIASLVNLSVYVIFVAMESFAETSLKVINHNDILLQMWCTGNGIIFQYWSDINQKCTNQLDSLRIALISQRCSTLGGAQSGGYEPNIRTQPIFLYNAPTLTQLFKIILLLVRKLSC